MARFYMYTNLPKATVYSKQIGQFSTLSCLEYKHTYIVILVVSNNSSSINFIQAKKEEGI